MEEKKTVDLKNGLSQEEVAQRIAQGLTNESKNPTSRSFVDILRANVLTRFNAILTALAIAVIIAKGGSLNTLFFWIMLANSGIGIFQEVRAKRSLDALSILAEAKATVLREGKEQTIPLHEVVQDDLILLELGNQVVADGQILKSSGLEIDESLLTGESDPIVKTSQEQVLSGSIVVAGSGLMQAQAVGDASYSSQLTSAAKQFKRASSELMDSTNRLLRWISWILLVVAPILIWGQLKFGNDWHQAIIRSVAALVGMVPEGLVMLTSVAFMVAVIRLSRNKVLVQSLPAVETLARVDTLLLDKTGTLTEGSIQYERVLSASNSKFSQKKLEAILVSFAAMGKSPTNAAILAGISEAPLKTEAEIPFSSARKWSALKIEGQAFILGAPEVLLSDLTAPALKDFKEEAAQIAGTGKRVLVAVSSSAFPENEKLPSTIDPLAIIVLSENIRKDAKDTLAYFAKQDVDIKIISGDSPLTVAAVAKEVALGGGEKVRAFDARLLPDPSQDSDAFFKVVLEHQVFGRVQPEQKRAIAAALQTSGRTVAMTGDGVNDALALKKADLGIAMQSGSDATKAVAEIVLLDNRFSHLPSVLAEGRRVIANIERVANLFLIKNIYSVLLAIGVTVFGLAYPYLPVQMTLINFLSIGLPAFFFALAPNARLYRPGFLKRIIAFSLPIGGLSALAMLLDYYIVKGFGLSSVISGTSVSIVTMLISLAVLIILANPMRFWKVGLIAFSAIAFAILVIWPYSAHLLRYQIDWQMLPATLSIGLLGALLVLLLQRLLRRIFSKEG